jgi:hypothetical protein
MQGKRNARQHMVRHGVFADLPEESMKELGESPEEYERQREALYQAFGPQDGFEEMLVEDMARLRWRWRRLMRAESGLVACKKRQYEIDREIEKFGRGGVREAALAVAAVGNLGYAGLPDSVEKYEHILGALLNLRQAVSTGGFDQKHEPYLELVYGKWGSLAGFDLKVNYEACRKRVESGESWDEASGRASFLADLDREIAAYEKVRELCRARDLKTTQAMKDAQLLPQAKDLDMILRYESGLERQFRRKLRQLVTWRRAKRRGSGRAAVPQPRDTEVPAPEPSR